MNARVDQILTEALGLPVEERSALMVALLDSVEGSGDSSVKEAWREELLRRREALKSGSIKPVPWAEAKTRITSL